MQPMHRRAFLKSVAGAASLAAAAGLASPAVSQRAAARTLRFVPQADLSNFDPVWSTTVVVRNAAAMVWDMLYGIDDELVAQRQMIEAEEVSDGGLTWTFRLRRAVASGLDPKKIIDGLTVFSGSTLIERVHPLQFGYVRRKVRTQRRFGMPIVNPLLFYAWRAADFVTTVRSRRPTVRPRVRRSRDRPGAG